MEPISSPVTINALARYLDNKNFSKSKKQSNKKDGIDLVSSFRTIGIPETYPAVKSLIYIGKPALPVLLTIIENEEINSLKSQNALYIITFYFRGKQQEAIEFLRKHAETVESDTKKQRLLYATEKITNSTQQTMDK